MSVDNEPAGSKEGQETVSRREMLDDLDSLVGDGTRVARYIDQIEARLNAAIEASSIAESARLGAEARIRELEGKAALADEEWAGEEDGFITRDDDIMGRKKEFCVVCLVSQYGLQVGARPFPHRKSCRKARYDALLSPSTGEKASTEGEA